jgi:hypothetical protein
LIDEGSSSVPILSTRNCGLAAELANSWQPQLWQNRREISLPLSAVLTKLPSEPATSIADVGKIAFAVPLPENFWHTRHQQIRATSGSPLTL